MQVGRVVAASRVEPPLDPRGARSARATKARSGDRATPATGPPFDRPSGGGPSRSSGAIRASQEETNREQIADLARRQAGRPRRSRVWSGCRRVPSPYGVVSVSTWMNRRRRSRSPARRLTICAKSSNDPGTGSATLSESKCRFAGGENTDRGAVVLPGRTVLCVAGPAPKASVEEREPDAHQLARNRLSACRPAARVVAISSA